MSARTARWARFGRPLQVGDAVVGHRKMTYLVRVIQGIEVGTVYWRGSNDGGFERTCSLDSLYDWAERFATPREVLMLMVEPEGSDERRAWNAYAARVESGATTAELAQMLARYQASSSDGERRFAQARHWVNESAARTQEGVDRLHADIRAILHARGLVT